MKVGRRLRYQASFHTAERARWGWRAATANGLARPADSMAPDGRGGPELDDPLALAMPAGHGDPLPAGVLVSEASGEVRQAGVLGPRPPDRPGLARWCWPVQGRVQSQVGDADQAMSGESRQQVQGREAAVAQQHDFAPWQPPPRLQGKLPCPVGQFLVALALLTAGTPRGGKYGQESQHPDPARPKDRGQQHQTEPAQTAGLHKVTFGGADWIAVDALGADALAAMALDRVVDAEHDRANRHEGGDQAIEQQASRPAGIPGDAVENPMVVGAAPLPAEPDDP